MAQRQVLARTSRPAQFSDVVGQEAVCRALTLSLQAQRHHHAYLLTGSHGVGKTTLARIIARCLNCDQGISATPCGACASCGMIQAGSCLDVLELDAASRTRVEDTLALLETAHYPPQSTRLKVLILDEVHMLSQHSFNALLKTLEEPPAHLVFVLATTDPQKLPATVRSRCLQLNLKPVAPEVLQKHLASVLDREQVIHEAKALEYIVRAAHGSVRDALSLVEQLLAWDATSVRVEGVRHMLGLLPQDTLETMLGHIWRREGPELVALGERLLAQGIDVFATIETVTEEAYQACVKSLDPRATSPVNASQAQMAYELCVKAHQEAKQLFDPRLAFRMLLVRLVYFAPWEDRPTPSKMPPAEAKHKTKVMSSPSATAPQVATPTATRLLKDVSVLSRAQDWPSVVASLPLKGLLKAFADQTAWHSWNSPDLVLSIPHDQQALLSDMRTQTLAEHLTHFLNSTIRVQVVLAQAKEQKTAPEEAPKTLKSWEVQKRTQKEEAFMDVLKQDAPLQALVRAFDATLTEVHPGQRSKEEPS